MSHTDDLAVARLACSWLLWYPDAELVARLPMIVGAVSQLPEHMATPLLQFCDHLEGSDLLEVQQHYVAIFDMRRKACPYLSYWTDGDTRNRGQAILRFKQAYNHAGWHLGDDELPDHIAVVLEFAAVGDRLTGEAFLAEHAPAIGLLRDALAKFDSAYVHVLDAVLATMPEITPAVRARMAEIAAQGPPAELVGLAPFPTTIPLEEVGGRR